MWATILAALVTAFSAVCIAVSKVVKAMPAWGWLVVAVFIIGFALGHKSSPGGCGCRRARYVSEPSVQAVPESPPPSTQELP